MCISIHQSKQILFLANVIFNSNKTNFNAMELKSEADDDDDGLRFNGQIGMLLQ